MDSISVGNVLAKGSVHAFGKQSAKVRNFVSSVFATSMESRSVEMIYPI